MRNGRESDYSFIFLIGGISASSVSVWIGMLYGHYDFSVSEKEKMKMKNSRSSMRDHIRKS